MNAYGLDAHSLNLNVVLFAENFAREFQWKSDREKTLFQMTVQNVIRMTNRADKFVSDFCVETGYDRVQMDGLMSEMFYKWSEYLDQLNKRN